MLDSHGNLDVRPARHRPAARREALRRLQASVRHAGRRFFYAGSGTPISTTCHDQRDHRVRRTAAATWAARRAEPDRSARSHELASGATKPLRFELNVMNVFNQKTATHMFNY